MRIWVDLANSPQVLFFRPLLEEWRNDGHELAVTTRTYAQTVALADQLGLGHEPVGAHGGARLLGLGGGLLRRAAALRRWARGRRIDLAVSHNSYAQLIAARWLGVPGSTTMDYEHQAANHLAFRLARRVVLPACFPTAAARRCGAGRKLRRYDGIKEEVYLADFAPAPGIRARHGIPEDAILAVFRPAADWALYHRGVRNPLPGLLMDRLLEAPGVRVVFLPRVPAQAESIPRDHAGRVTVPDGPLDGPALLAAADMVFSAGGTMSREAAVLGTPAFTLFAGAPAAVDAHLERLGRLRSLRTPADIAGLSIARKTGGQRLPGGNGLVRQVADLLAGPGPDGPG